MCTCREQMEIDGHCLERIGIGTRSVAETPRGDGRTSIHSVPAYFRLCEWVGTQERSD